MLVVAANVGENTQERCARQRAEQMGRVFCGAVRSGRVIIDDNPCDPDSQLFCAEGGEEGVIDGAEIGARHDDDREVEMGYSEIVTAARRLPMDEQLQLVEELVRGMREATATVTPASRKRRAVKRFSQLRGALEPEGLPPTDNELEDEYTEHLIEKYL